MEREGIVLNVPIDKIMPVTEARANISKLVDNVEKGDVYVLTRGGKPSVVVASVEYIKKITENASAPRPEIVRNIDVKDDVHKEKNDLPGVLAKSPEEIEKFEKKDEYIVEKKEENKLPEQYENKPNTLAMPDGIGEDDPVDKVEKVPVRIAAGN